LIYLERLLQGSRSFFYPPCGGSFFFIMTKQEKIALQQEHTTNALAFKEGVFWVAYEQSAYFIAQLKKYKPTNKSSKSKFIL
jgi:hypothetical protein